MDKNKDKIIHRQKSDMTGGGTPSRLAANVTSHGIVCSALLGGMVFLFGWLILVSIVGVSLGVFEALVEHWLGISVP
jgi:hypothetical protein